MTNTPNVPSGMITMVDHVVAVTGSGGGIGSGIARRFAAAGASLILHYHSSAESVAALTEELSVAVVPVQADIAEESGAQRIVDAAVGEFGQIDVLINNAGTQLVAGFDSMTLDEWHNMINVNLTGTHLVTQAAAKAMIDGGRGGSVVHIASIEGSQPGFMHGHYAISKAAVIMHARAAALEYGPKGIRINCVSPGLIDRPGLAEAWPEGVERWQTAAPLDRLGTPEDIGDACVFLASPLARWITGHNLVVDGGVSIHPTW